MSVLTAAVKYIMPEGAIPYTPGSDVAANSVVVQGALVGVVLHDITAGEQGTIHTAGVFEFDKPTGAGTDSTAGTAYYWDAADQNAQEDADGGANVILGKSIAAVTTADTKVRILLTQ